ncbi:MAG: hypothetical protein ACFFD2_17495 [Promethearchaeota archaeon]
MVQPILPFDETGEIVQWLLNKAEQVIEIKYVKADYDVFRRKLINFLFREDYEF